MRLQGAQGDRCRCGWYPPGFDPRKKYPVLHSITAARTLASGDTFHYRWNNHVFAAQGYVVACVNYHGSSGFGYDFLDSITHRWGELELHRDVEAGTDWLLKPWVDRQRVFATGGSYGGYMVAWMNGHVAGALRRLCRLPRRLLRLGFDVRRDAYTWFPRELGAWYWVTWPRFRAEPACLRRPDATPTLVIHGALDYPRARRPGPGLPQHAQGARRGRAAGVVPDENHWILKPRNSGSGTPSSSPG